MANQELTLARWEVEQARCGQHPGPREECADPERPWFPQRSICYAAMEEAAANRSYDRLHKDLPYHDGTFGSWAKEPSASHPYHSRDGIRIWVAPEELSPDDNFLRPSGGERYGSEA